MKIVEAIHDYISKCPYIKEFEVNVNYLEDKYDSYMIEETPFMLLVSIQLLKSS